MIKYIIKINLLPYRKIVNDQNKKEFLLNLLVSIVIGIFLAIGIFFILKINYFNSTIKSNYLYNEIRFLNTELDIYKKELNYNKQLKYEKKILESLQVNRYKLYRILNDLNSFLPERGVYLTSIHYSNANAYIINGKAVNDNLVALFMKSIPSTGLFKNVNLMEIKSDNSKENNFTIIAFLFNYVDNFNKK